MTNGINKRAWQIRRNLAQANNVKVMKISWKVCYVIARAEYQAHQQAIATRREARFTWSIQALYVAMTGLAFISTGFLIGLIS